MSRHSGPNDPDESQDSSSDPARGLEDPRAIHPAPEGLFPETGAGSNQEADRESSDASGSENPPSEDQERGLVDPKNEEVGPDL